MRRLPVAQMEQVQVEKREVPVCVRVSTMARMGGSVKLWEKTAEILAMKARGMMPARAAAAATAM